MSLRTFSHGTVRWMPLAGRIESGSTPSSSVRDLVGPDPGGVDDRARPDRRTGGRRRRRRAPSTCPSPSLVSPTTRHRLATTAPWSGRGAGDREHEPGVVGGGVVVQVAAGQAVPRHRRQVGERLVGVEALVQLADAEPAGEVVHPHRRAEGPGDPAGDQAVPGEDRDHERQQLDQVGSVAAEALALVERLVDEADVALLEVAQSPVDELGALRRGAAGEVVGFDQRRAQAPGGGVEGDPDAGDPAADDEHVEVLVRRGARASPRRSNRGADPASGATTENVVGTAEDCLWRTGPDWFYRSASQNNLDGGLVTCRSRTSNGASSGPAGDSMRASSTPTTTTTPRSPRPCARRAASGRPASNTP